MLMTATCAILTCPLGCLLKVGTTKWGWSKSVERAASAYLVISEKLAGVSTNMYESERWGVKEQDAGICLS